VTRFFVDNATRNPPSSPASSSLLGTGFKTNIHRNKTKRWVEAPKVDYGGGWGDDDDDDNDNYRNDGYKDYSVGEEKKHNQPAPLSVTSSRSLSFHSGLAAPHQGQDHNRERVSHPQSSFERGDDRVVTTPLNQDSQSGKWNLPPTPLELEQQERRSVSSPQFKFAPQTHVQPTSLLQFQGEPAIQAPVSRVASQTPTMAAPNETNKHFSEVNPQFVLPVSPMGTDTKPAQSYIQPAPPVQQQPPPSPPLATQPPPPPVDSDRSASRSTSESLSNPKRETKWAKVPSYDDYEDNYSSGEDGGSSQSPLSNVQQLTPKQPAVVYPLPPGSSPASALPYSPITTKQLTPLCESSSTALEQFTSVSSSHESFPSSPTIQTPASSSMSPPHSPSKPKIPRPSDIYKHHQEQEQHRLSIDLHRRNADSHESPPVLSPAPSTMDSTSSHGCLPSEPHLPKDDDQSIQTLGLSQRESGVPISQETPSVRFREQIDRPPSSTLSSTAPLHNLPTRMWTEDVYSESPIDDIHNPMGVLSVADSSQQAAISDLSPDAIQVQDEDLSNANYTFQNAVTAAFTRHDALQSDPSSETTPSYEGTSPIIPRLIAPQESSWKPLNTSSQKSEELVLGQIKAGSRRISTTSTKLRTPSPDDLRDITRESPRLSLPPLVTDGLIASIDEATPISSVERGGSPEKDALDAFIGELVRARTPDPSASTSKHSPGMNRRIEYLDVPQSAANPRESMGIYTLYDSYWQEREEDRNEMDNDLGQDHDGRQEDEESNNNVKNYGHDQHPQSLSLHSPLLPPIQPKSPLRGVGLRDEERRSIHEEVVQTSLASPPSPSDKTVSPPSRIPVSGAVSEEQKVEEPSTPSSSADEELLEMISAGKLFLDRRSTYGLSASSNRNDDGNPEQQQLSRIMESKPHSFSNAVGPESEGIEAITGPTVEKRPRNLDERTPIENEYAKELVNQFSRPQTLMLKETMLMPSGMLVMPPMPPMAGGKEGESAPEVVNFDKDDDTEGLEVVSGSHANSAYTPSFSSGQNHIHPRPSSARTIRSTRVILQDTDTIAQLPTAAERINAYKALRNHLETTPTMLSEWIAYQLEQNNGEQLLRTPIVSVNPDLAAQKRKGKVTLHSLPSDLEDSKEKLERVGRGAMKLGEKAGGKVGGWMKRVGKKVQ
jgi:hypothetical protein